MPRTVHQRTSRQAFTAVDRATDADYAQQFGPTAERIAHHASRLLIAMTDGDDTKENTHAAELHKLTGIETKEIRERLTRQDDERTFEAQLLTC